MIGLIFNVFLSIFLRIATIISWIFETWFSIPERCRMKNKIFGIIGTVLFIIANIMIVLLIVSCFAREEYLLNGEEWDGNRVSYVSADSAREGNTIIYDENQMAQVTETYREEEGRFAVLDNGEIISFSRINGKYYKTYHRKNEFVELDAKDEVAYKDFNTVSGFCSNFIYYFKQYLKYEENDFTFFDQLKIGALGIWYQLGDIVSFFKR